MPKAKRKLFCMINFVKHSSRWVVKSNNIVYTIISICQMSQISQSLRPLGDMAIIFEKATFSYILWMYTRNTSGGIALMQMQQCGAGNANISWMLCWRLYIHTQHWTSAGKLQGQRQKNDIQNTLTKHTQKQQENLQEKLPKYLSRHLTIFCSNKQGLTAWILDWDLIKKISSDTARGLAPSRYQSTH